MDLQNAATIIHAAYPDLPICDVYSATKNKDIVQSAFKFALKNTYTHDKIKTFFSHFKDIRTDFGRNSGIVDKRIKCSEIGDHIFEKFFAVFSA